MARVAVTPDAYGLGSGHGGSSCPRLQKLFPSISRKVETSIIDSAKSFFSFAFSSSSCFSPLASLTYMPQYFERQL